jgi:anti-sigma-K factor RskA
MYRDGVDQSTRNDIAAAAAVHSELGRDYDAAVAEGLVDRIGAEIDKRIDARLGSPRPASRPLEQSSGSARGQAVWAGIGVGAAITGLVALLANNGSGDNTVVDAVIVIWAVLAIAGVSTAVVRRYRLVRRYGSQGQGQGHSG